MSDHLPVRPSLACVCGAEWPCANAMVLLEEEFRGSRPSLTLYLVDKWFDAARDLPDANGSAPRSGGL